MIDLYKFTKREYIDGFLEGKLYMNSLGYFWENGFESQKDYYEGVGSLQNPKKIIPNPALQKAIIGSVALRYDVFKYCHLACFYIHEYDPIKKLTLRFEKRMQPFGDYVIRITDIDAFHNRLSDYAQKHRDFYFARPVQYHSRDEVLDVADCFDKIEQLSWQREWRIGYLRSAEELVLRKGDASIIPYSEPITVDIGSLRGITEVYRSRDIIGSPLNIYRGYRIVDHISERVPLDTLGTGWRDRESFRRLFLQGGNVGVGPIFTLGRK